MPAGKPLGNGVQLLVDPRQQALVRAPAMLADPAQELGQLGGDPVIDQSDAVPTVWEVRLFDQWRRTQPLCAGAKGALG